MVTALDGVLLLAAGVLAGVASTVAGLASLVSYPALLAVGLPPLSANVTNTVALVATGVGAAAGSRPELRGQRQRLRLFGALTGCGGAVGALLLLTTPPGAFAIIVPWLVGGASLVLLLQPRLSRVRKHDVGESSPRVLAAAFGVAVYAGYFGAAAGVLMLALLAAAADEPLVRLNAVKNVVNALANAVAAIGFALFGPVNWAAVVPLAIGFLVGGGLGPTLARRLPGDTLRLVVALAGFGLAVKLGIDAWQ